jgi:hypothetical protein
MDGDLASFKGRSVGAGDHAAAQAIIGAVYFDLRKKIF